MFGRNIFGKARFAAGPSSTASLGYSPAPATVIFQGGAAVTVSGISPIKPQQIVREIMRNAPSEGRLQIQQTVREVLRGPAGDLQAVTHIRQLVREVMRAGSFSVPQFHARQCIREILRSSLVVASGRRRQLILPNVGPWL